ncbi:MAG: hypothetical protein U5K30_08030 [Acidimicrobiales bacterium]|nr:hypothetical protein [Acidimicrobiales bacterium]
MGLWAALGTGVAGAQEEGSVDDPYVLDDGQEDGAVGSGNEVLSSGVSGAGDPASTAVKSSALAFTGTEVLVLAAVGGGLVLAGTTVVVTSRRRARADA